MDVKLVMFTEKGERRDFPLLASGLLVGRHEQCALRIPLPEVSRRHAEIRIIKGQVVVKDLGSANGTFVNNKRVKELKLNAGDHLVIGPVVFTIQIDGEPRQITPVKTKLERRQQEVPSAADTTTPQTAGEVYEDKDADPISTLEALASEDSKAGLSGSFFLDDIE